MAQDLSIEDPEHAYFITTRTQGSRLWFVNNRRLEWYILAYLAKYQEYYEVIIYGFVMMGNHYHLAAHFPRGNKTDFLRSFNSIIARLTKSLTAEYDGSKVWARRARCQLLPNPEDIKNWVLYAEANPVSSGLVRTVSDYPSYNSHYDAAVGRVRPFKLVNRSDYTNRSRYNSKLTIEDCTKTYHLKYTRLPGHEGLTSSQYRSLMQSELARRTHTIIQERAQAGKVSYLSRKELLKVVPGSRPLSTKTSTRDSKRPLVLSLCPVTRAFFVDRYFRILEAFREASLKYRAGNLLTHFPPGTYRPVLLSPLTG
jgi:REP element-mobilizing transposase RayT